MTDLGLRYWSPPQLLIREDKASSAPVPPFFAGPSLGFFLLAPGPFGSLFCVHTSYLLIFDDLLDASVSSRASHTVLN